MNYEDDIYRKINFTKTLNKGRTHFSVIFYRKKLNLIIIFEKLSTIIETARLYAFKRAPRNPSYLGGN